MDFTLGLPSGLGVDYKSLEERYLTHFEVLKHRSGRAGNFYVDYYLLDELFPRKQTKLLQSKSKCPRIVRVVIK